MSLAGLEPAISRLEDGGLTPLGYRPGFPGFDHRFGRSGPNRQKNVRQKNGISIFLSYIFLSGGRDDDQGRFIQYRARYFAKPAIGIEPMTSRLPREHCFRRSPYPFGKCDTVGEFHDQRYQRLGG